MVVSNLSWTGLYSVAHVGLDRPALEPGHPNGGQSCPNHSRANAVAGEWHNSLWWPRILPGEWLPHQPVAGGSAGDCGWPLLSLSC